MKAFIVLLATVALCTALPGYPYAPAPLGHDGRVIDTPEVAHAKAEHFARYHQEAARNSLHGHDPAYSYAGHEAYHFAPEIRYHGPPAPLDHEGRVVDTPEVAHLKAAHLHAHAVEASKTAAHPYVEYHYSPSYSYGYPYTAPLGPDGRVVDTPEVAHAKAAHHAAYHAAAAQAHHP